MKFLLILSIFFASYATCQSKEQPVDKYYASSVSEMVHLQRLKHLLVSKLEFYSKELKSKLRIVKNGIAQLGIQLDRLEKDIKNGEDHVVNYFRILRHQHFDWAYWLNFIKQEVATAAQEQIQEMRQHLPIQDDFNGAFISVFLILDVYLIEPQEFAKGLLNGRQYKSRLDALDCYALAQFALKNKYYTEAKEWLNLSWHYHTELDELQQKYYKLMGFDPVEFLRIYATFLLRINQKPKAWDVLHKALLISPSSPSIYRQMRITEKNFYFLSKPPKSVKNTYFPGHRECCRGEYEYPKGLSCYYEFKKDPFLRLAPFKVEPLHQNPFVAVYHDVLYDSEIAELKRLAVPTINRSLIIIYNQSVKAVPYKARTSNSVFIYNNDSHVVEILRQRVMDMTNLIVNPNSSDNLLVMNYGLGGHYSPHFDWFGEEQSRFTDKGDRLATVLFYLTDVPQGGATVFPLLRLTYFPKKGSALIFHNLFNNMTGDYHSMHSGCPVLFGSKWAATKWIYNTAQMFRWPCLLENVIKTNQ